MKSTIKKLALCISLFSLMLIIVNAQNEVDAFRFSEIDWEGTARFMGAGKAFGAVGAEFSALNTNPASIGLYKKSEITFTPMALSIFKNSSGYNGKTTAVQDVKYNIGSAGIVFAFEGISSTLWKKFQFGYGYNRIKDYNNAFTIGGRNGGRSIGSLLAFEAEGLNYKDVYEKDSPWSSELWGAWNSFLIDTIAGKETSYRSMMEKVDMKHSSKVERRGGVDEMVFSFGANYDDILFLGATVGLPFINFTENRTFVEENDRYRNDYLFQYYKMKDKLNVRSTGINLKLGALYQPVDFMRVGFAFHTPTYYGNVKDNFERRVEIAFDSYESYANRFNYTLTTPLRVMANVAFFIKKRAFVSAEYELVDYSMANLSSMDYDFNDLDGENENQTIRDLYGLSHTLRIGAEVNLNEVFAIRAGYNYISSPYKDGYSREYNGLKFSGAKHYASFGFGFRTRVFYSDFAYAITTSKDLYWMYNPQYVNAVGNKFITHKVMLTMGIRF